MVYLVFVDIYKNGGKMKEATIRLLVASVIAATQIALLITCFLNPYFPETNITDFISAAILLSITMVISAIFWMYSVLSFYFKMQEDLEEE